MSFLISLKGLFESFRKIYFRFVQYQTKIENLAFFKGETFLWGHGISHTVVSHLLLFEM